MVFSLSMTSSKVKNGRQIFMKPSTSPILISSVTMATMSLGAMTCANCEFVSSRLSTGDISITFFHGSLSSWVNITKIFSMMICSISENSLPFSKGTPLPPSMRSSIAYPRLIPSSMIIEPFKGIKLIIPMMIGLDKEFVNSLNVMASDPTTETCTFLRRYTGRFVEINRA